LRLGALSPSSRLQHPITNPIVHFECVWKRGSANGLAGREG
jgi:hypothetical protein